jgi:hypothetical protein
MKKRFFLGFLVLLVAAGSVLVGCSSDPEEPDTWSNVTSLDQLNGTWNGSYSQTLSFQDFSGDEWEESMATLFGDATVTISATMHIVINANAKTTATSGSTTMTFSGSNINLAWAFITPNFSSEEGVTINDSNYSITIPFSSEAEELTDSDITEMLAYGLQINQNGTKVKIPAGVMDEDIPAMILVKQ